MYKGIKRFISSCPVRGLYFYNPTNFVLGALAPVAGKQTSHPTLALASVEVEEGSSKPLGGAHLLRE